MGRWVNLRIALFVLSFRLVAHHMYTAFFWIWNAPILIESTVDESGSFVDKIIHAWCMHNNASLPSKITDPELHKLVKLYQHYRHPKTCYKIGMKNVDFTLENSIQSKQLLPNHYHQIYQKMQNIWYWLNENWSWAMLKTT